MNDHLTVRAAPFTGNFQDSNGNTITGKMLTAKMLDFWGKVQDGDNTYNQTVDTWFSVTINKYHELPTAIVSIVMPLQFYYKEKSKL